MMNKFRGSQDTNFRLVSNALKDFAINARIHQTLTVEESKCLGCLSSNYRDDKDRNQRRVPGTCKWFLENPTFLNWLARDTVSLLWVTADPGCGKSVLAKALIDEGFLNIGRTKPTLCYFFFKDDDESRQSGADALSAILHQLFVQKPALIKYAMPRYMKHRKSFAKIFSSLWEVLEDFTDTSEIGTTICILDALDECRHTERQLLIIYLSRFFSNVKRRTSTLRFIITSRPYENIIRDLHDAIDDASIVSLKGEDESETISNEIDLVIANRVPSICKARTPFFKAEVQKSIVEHLKQIPHGTYLWLHLILDAIRKSLSSTVARLQNLIENLPSTVEDAYERLLEKIDSSDSAKQAKRFLHIIVAATRPMTLTEMNVAYTID